MNALTQDHLLHSSALSSAGPDAARHDDSGLIQQCAELSRLSTLCQEVEASNLYKGQSINADGVWDRCEADLWVPFDQISDEIGKTAARTPEGLLAKAAAMRLEFIACGWDTKYLVEDTDGFVKLARSLCNDIGTFSAAAPSSNPDAELIAACAQFEELEHACGWNAPEFDLPSDSPEWPAIEAKRNHLYRLQRPLLGRIFKLPATTPQGRAARARCAVASNPDLVAPGTGSDDQVMLHAMLRDLISEGAAS